MKQGFTLLERSIVLDINMLINQEKFEEYQKNLRYGNEEFYYNENAIFTKV